MEVTCAIRSWKHIKEREREYLLHMRVMAGSWTSKSALKTNSNLPLQDCSTHAA